MARQVFIVAAKRTPFGRFGGALREITATDLCVTAAKAALVEAKLDPSAVDSVVVGNVLATSPNSAYIARHVLLKAGIPLERPALTVNRLCGSGFQSVVNGMQEIQLGLADIALCGGSENMSRSPLAVYGHKARFGVKLGAGVVLEDTLWKVLTDSHVGMPMGITAETLAEEYGISREQCDAYALRSQKLRKKAHDEGCFNAELAPVTIEHGYGDDHQSTEIVTDEAPHSTTTMQRLAALPTVFKRGGVVTAGSASGIADGAGAILLASEEAVEKHHLTPLARVVSYHVAGVEPSRMGIGPVSAIRGALARAQLKLEDMDLIEINEAFSATCLACLQELDLPDTAINQCGGAIALGHPLAASGSRILAHLTHRLRQIDRQWGIGSSCIGGGQGIAVVLENVM